MFWLDCTDEAAALQSLADVTAIPTSTLFDAVSAYDEARLSAAVEKPADELMPQEVLEGFGVTTDEVASSFTGAYYFHGTRTGKAESFWRYGILSLADALDGVWELLRELTRPAVSRRDWGRYRERIESGADDSHSAYLYRLKVENPHVGGGPFARLVRAAHIDPSPPERDYLKNPPEIVEDIITILENHRLVLHEPYMAATRPCLVKFRSSRITSTEVEAAMWYLFNHSRGRAPGRWASQSNFCGEGSPVPAADIVQVDVLDS